MNNNKIKQSHTRINCIVTLIFIATPVGKDPLGPAKIGQKTGPAKIGQKLFFDRKPDRSGQWRGWTFNPEDGKTYSSKMTLSGRTLTNAGCVFDGLICKRTSWSKVAMKARA